MMVEVGTALDPLVLDQGAGLRGVGLLLGLMLILPLYLALLVSWGGHGFKFIGAVFPYSVGILCKFTAFLETLHWPVGSEDMGHLGISFSELLILFEQWAGHRLLSEKVTSPRFRANRPILIPSVPVSEGIEIRHGCPFISSLVRALAELPGGIGRFLPAGIGSRMSRLRHLGWDQCSHGLTSRPLESCHHQCLKAVREVLGVS